MKKINLKRLFAFVYLSLLSLTLNASLTTYQVDINASSGAYVYLGFVKNTGSDNLSYGYDSYGTYLSGFPSLNDNGDIAGRATFSYLDPNSGKKTNQSEAAVWIGGKIHRFGVINCSTASCKSRATKINNARDTIIGSSHMAIASTTPYFERSIKWFSKEDNWSYYSGGLDQFIQSYIEDINDQGSVVGSSIVNREYVRHAQVVINQTKYIIGSFDQQSLGMAINNNNSAVGSIISNNREQAFLWRNGTDPKNPQILPSFGDTYSRAYDINDENLIVGESKNSDNNRRAVLWQNSSLVDLGTLGGQKSVARSINNPGLIVGYSETAQGRMHGFIYVDETMEDLNDHVEIGEGWVIVDAYSVNENGQILVRAQKNRSSMSEDNAYWLLSPGDFTSEGPADFSHNGTYCQWGQENCEISYPPEAVENAIYQLPSGQLPIIDAIDIPQAAAYVCNADCENYASFLPQFPTINEAINNTVSADKIVIFPGVYYETIKLRSRKLMGLLREYTIINSDGLNMRPVNLQGNSKISNVAITGGNALHGGGIQVSGKGNMIDNCIIQGNTASYDGGGVHGLSYSAFTMTNSIISQNKARFGGGYVSWSYSSAYIKQNKFTANKAMYGAGAFFGSYVTIFFNANIVDQNNATRDGGGVYVNSYTNDKYVRNSLITNNTSGRYGAGVYRGAILGSVVYGNESGVVKYSAVFGTTSQNSIIWGNAGTTSASGVHDSIVEDSGGFCSYCSNVINANPMFVDAQNGNFRLQNGSPAIDTGSDTSNKFGQYQDDDFNAIKRGIDGDGNGLSAGNDYDMGAFEYFPF